MDEGTRPSGTPAVTVAEGDPNAIRAQIEATRTALGDTVAALAVKADVKQQARNRIEALKLQASSKWSELTRKLEGTPDNPQSGPSTTQLLAAEARLHPVPVAAAGAIAAGFLLGRLTAR